MRKFIIAAAVTTSALAATPAAAQYYPAPQQVPYGYGYGQPQGYGYGQPQGYGYDHRDQQGLIRSYIVRADQLRQRVERLDNRDRISEREARRLRQEAADLQQRARGYAAHGLNGRERQDLDIRIARLQQAIRYERQDGNDRRYGQNDYREWTDEYGRRNTFIDRNGNGLDDRWERNRQRDRDDD
jgi:hypothetical protein